MESFWRDGPYGLDAEVAATVRTERTVLVVAHHVAGATRLAGVAALLESDRRVQVVYTACPASRVSGGVEEYLRQLGGVVIPFEVAMRCRWSAVVVAGDGLVERLHGPVLHFPHGVGPSVRQHRWRGDGRPVQRPVTGLRREVIVAGGRVIPTGLLVANERHAAALTRLAPEAESTIRVVGDLTLDRLQASASSRNVYRAAFGVEEKLLVISSTWGPRSLVARCPDLPLQLALALRGRYQIALVVHPNVVHWHGRRQIAGWFRECRALGVRLVAPERGWQAALVAADRLVGDHGSVTCLGVGVGIPTLIAAFPVHDVLGDSDIGLAASLAGRVDHAAPLGPQVEAAVTAPDVARLRDRLTSHPGQAARLTRTAIYEAMELPEPSSRATTEPVEPPLFVEVAS